MALIKFRDITVAYGKNTILKNINLEIKQGEITTLLGPNGSGKTTLMSTLNGLIKPVSGNITVDDKDILKMKPKELAKIVATVPQFHNASFDFKVSDMVLSGRSPYIEYMPKQIDREKAMYAIKRVGIEYLKDKEYTKISGGERQLVMIARAIAQESKIIVLDEPATYLDLKNQIKVLNLIKEINEEKGTTCIMTLHEPNYALTYSDKIVLVYKGEVRLGNPEEIVNRENMKAVYEISCDILEHKKYKYVLPEY